MALKLLSLCFFVLLLFDCPAAAQSKKPVLIRDTEEAEATDMPVAKEPNPALSAQNINIGDFYLKKKNYAAAIRRYLEAIEYAPDSARAYDALAKAYKKKGDPAKAISIYKEFVEKYPDLPESDEFRERIEKLQKNPR